MNTKTLSDKALAVIEQYLAFHMGKTGTTETKGVTCSIPYYNNRRREIRGGLRALIGKGSPKDIFDEVEIIMLKEKVSLATLNDETFKWFLVDHNIGIDCSGFAYHVLNAEGLAHNKSGINHYLSFPYCRGILGKLKSMVRPVGVTNVRTLAHDSNSVSIPLSAAKVGDMITMLDTDKSRDHVLVIHQIDYENNFPVTIYYTNSIAWPTDGQYNHGVRQGKIAIADAQKNITDQIWTESNITGAGDSTVGENYTFTRSRKAQTEIRRLKWFS